MKKNKEHTPISSNSRKLGIKGFDKNLKCRGFQYEIGKVYETDTKPRLCGKAFHYCQSIDDVYYFYPKDKENRYCIVEILGESEIGVGKCATNKIKILREIRDYDFSNTIAKETIRELTRAGFIIGGSLGLKIHGYQIGRPIIEVDLILKDSQIESIEKEFFHGFKKIPRKSDLDSAVCYIGLFGEKYDIIVDEDPSPVKRNYKGVDVLVQDSKVIWEKKFAYAMEGSMKHFRDIKENGIKFTMVMNENHSDYDPEDDWPF
jgi:hypothetical protein